DIVPTRAALVPFVFTSAPAEFMAPLAGVSVPVWMATGVQAFEDDMLFTHHGLSGPAALQLSSYWQEGTAITIDLSPYLTMSSHLLDSKRKQPRLLLRTVLTDHLPRALVQSLESLWWPEQAEKSLAEWPDRLLLEIAGKLSQWTLTPSGTEGYRTAEVTLGGVDTRGLSSQNMESRNCAGLYFIGEVVDVTGWLGGFNFQWAWSSAHAAGQAV
ncbi:MAG: NAD(P)/FAD-dependent oxidoreductase, partial [Gammaproteobacteria bacterium]